MRRLEKCRKSRVGVGIEEKDTIFFILFFLLCCVSQFQTCRETWDEDCGLNFEAQIGRGSDCEGAGGVRTVRLKRLESLERTDKSD